MMHVDPEILTVDDLAKLFSCDKETAAARLTSGDLPGVKVGRGWIIPRQALFERLNEKAREESAARRAYQTSTFNEAERRGREIPMTDPLFAASQSVLPTAAVAPKRSKRRIPPPLPSLSK